MSARPAPVDLVPWALSALGLPAADESPAVTMVAGDASHRRYFRLTLGTSSYMLVDAPPATEKNAEFVRVQHLLAAGGVRVPALLAADLRRGFLLLEDLGSRVLLPLLDSASADAHYRQAFRLLEKLPAIGTRAAHLNDYDAALLGEELHRFPQWFVEALLGHGVDAREKEILERLFTLLIKSAAEQPRVLVHRDFHSRNLMLMGDGELAVIDFQDAVIGPVTYDLVSLLRDCYIRWPAHRVESWALDYRAGLCARGLLAGSDDEQWMRWFDWMGLQRHLKVLGTFARLSLRDGKAAYLDDLPLVLRYVHEMLDKYAPREPAFADFKAWFGQRLSPLVARHPWGTLA